MVKSSNFLLIIIILLQNIISVFISGGNVSYLSDILINQIFALFIPLMVFLIYRRQRISFDDEYTTLNIPNIIITTLCTLALSILAQYINIPVLHFMENYGINNYESYIPNGVFEFTAFLIFIAVIPAILEEFLFRKIVLVEYRGAYDDITAIILCGLSFAIMHANISSFLPQFLIGTFLSYITVKFGGIYLAVICHFVHNLSLLIVQKFFYDQVSNFLQEYTILILIIAIVILIYGISIIRKIKFNHKKISTDISARNTSIALWLFITISISIKIIFN